MSKFKLDDPVFYHGDYENCRGIEYKITKIYQNFFNIDKWVNLKLADDGGLSWIDRSIKMGGEIAEYDEILSVPIDEIELIVYES